MFIYYKIYKYKKLYYTNNGFLSEMNSIKSDHIDSSTMLRVYSSKARIVANHYSRNMTESYATQKLQKLMFTKVKPHRFFDFANATLRMTLFSFVFI